MVSKKSIVPNGKIKIVLLIPQLRHGGAERVVSRLSYLLTEKYTPIVVVFDDKVQTYDVGCEIYSLNVPPEDKSSIFRKIFNVCKRVIKYRRFLKENDIGITYSFGDTANIVNIFAKRKDKKIISIRGYKRIQKQNTLINRILIYPLNRYTAKKADRVISVSKLISRDLNRNFNIANSKIFTIYNGYDTDSIRDKSLEPLEDFENEIFLKNRVLITAGTFREEKGYWHLIKAFYKVSLAINDVVLVILGVDFNNYKSKILKLASELGVSNKVFCLGYKENPYKYFRKSTAYVLSSIFEGFPNSLVEAMSCELPVVSTNCESGPIEILMRGDAIDTAINNYVFSDYGILTEKPITIPNFNPNVFDSTDDSLFMALSELLSNNNMIERYKKLSVVRSREFSYKSWLNNHVEAFNFEGVKTNVE